MIANQAKRAKGRSGKVKMTGLHARQGMKGAISHALSVRMPHVATVGSVAALTKAKIEAKDHSKEIMRTGQPALIEM